MDNYRNIKIDEINGDFNKKVTMNLVGMDGNAFSLMGQFSLKARRQGWTKEEIDYVLDQCKSGDYNNLLCVLIRYTQENEEDPEVIYHNWQAYRTRYPFGLTMGLINDWTTINRELKIKKILRNE